MKKWTVLNGVGEIYLGDCLEVLKSMDKKSVDMVFGSPPYVDARTYEDETLPKGFTMCRGVDEWIDWMIELSRAAVRVSRGGVFWVAAGKTEQRNYWPAVEGLIYHWWRRGYTQYRPVYWHRNGIPGSGGDQHFRADVEYVLCFKRDGPLPHADPKAIGEPPKYNPGGKLTYRDKDGKRRHKIRGTSGYKDGDAVQHRASEDNLLDRAVTDIANRGNMWFAHGDNYLRTNNGGGKLGSRIAHENEAPFPEELVRRFILTYTQKGDTVLDPFGGSGTTGAVCIKTGRQFKVIDVRMSQVDLMRKRFRQANMTKGFQL